MSSSIPADRDSHVATALARGPLRRDRVPERIAHPVAGRRVVEEVELIARFLHDALGAHGGLHPTFCLRVHCGLELQRQATVGQYFFSINFNFNAGVRVQRTR